jgi:hypothetical protein
VTLMLTDRIVEKPGELRLVAGTSLNRPRLHLVPPLQHRDPRPVAVNFARGVAEVMARTRSVDQLQDLATFEVVRIIERAATRQPAHRTRPKLRPRLRSVHISVVCDGVVEACAVIDGGVRSRALAFRLESNGRSWRATVVQLG